MALLDILGNLGSQVRAAGGVGNEPLANTLIRGQNELAQRQALQNQLGGTLGGAIEAGVPLQNILATLQEQRLGRTADVQNELLQSILKGGGFGAMPMPPQAQPSAQTAQQPTTQTPEEARKQQLLAQRAQAQVGTLSPITKPYAEAQIAAIDSELQTIQAGEKEISKAKGKARGEAVVDLPTVEDAAQQTIGLIDQLIGSREKGIPQHPGFSNLIGVGAPGARFVPGTETADANALFEQIKGKQFLEAFQSLKGGGQITEIEGKKGTQAISRMNRAQSEKEFIKAANEFKAVVQKGLERARKKAGITQQEQRRVIRFDAQGNPL